MAQEKDVGGIHSSVSFGASMSETIRQLAADGMLRGSYETSLETPLESPLQFCLWLAYQQVLRNNRQNVADVAAGE